MRPVLYLPNPHSDTWLGLRPRTWAWIGGGVGVSLAALAVFGSDRKKHTPPVGGINGWLGPADSGQDAAPGPEPGEGKPPRWPMWGPVHTVQGEISLHGWYSDVLTSPNDNWPCGATSLGDSLAKQDKHGSNFDCKDLSGIGDPEAVPFRMHLGPVDGAQIVRAVVTVSDKDGVTNATRWRTKKNSNARKNGNLDVNEYWFEGPRDETCYAEVLARRVDGASIGPYLTRRPTSCTPYTIPQPYHLYRAQRETAPKGWVGQVREWFAKVADGTPYPNRDAIPGGTYVAQYDLSMGVDGQGVYIDGLVAPSLPDLDLRVTVQWATRPG